MDTLSIFGLAIIAIALCDISQVLSQRRERRSREATARRVAIEAVGAPQARKKIV